MKRRLPFTEATLQEIQRLGVVAPLTVPHVALQNTKCQGYHIPKVSVQLIKIPKVQQHQFNKYAILGNFDVHQSLVD